MTRYRNEKELARSHRRIEELEDALDAEADAHSRTRRELVLAAQSEPPKPPWRSRLPKFRVSTPESGLAVIMVCGIIVVIVGVIALVVHHLYFDIRASYVRGTEHHAAHYTTQCSTVNNVTTCSPVYHPERWSVEIAHGEESASWSITEQEYVELERGQWFCVSGADPEECREP